MSNLWYNIIRKTESVVGNVTYLCRGIHRSLLVFGVYLRISNSSKYSPMAWVISIKKLLLYVATEGALYVTAKMMYVTIGVKNAS